MTLAAAIFRPHDLLRFDLAALNGQDVPEWAMDPEKAAAFAVVRRAECREGLVPIGMRGMERHQRWGGWLSRSAIIERLKPEALLSRVPGLPMERRAIVPALAALPQLATRLSPLPWRWGPTGSVGFELASGRATAKASSDLDLILRAQSPISTDDALGLLRSIADLDVRCDMLLETPAGATSLAEFARGRGPVVVRTASGPELRKTPWSEE